MTPADINILATRLAEQLTTPRWLKLRQAVQYGAIGKTALVSLLKEGEISGYQCNDRGDWVVDRESIDRYHEANMMDIGKRALEIMDSFV